MRGTWRWTPTPSCRRPARRRTTARPRRSAAPWSWTTAAAARTPARRRRTLPTIRSRKSRLPCRRSLGRSCFSLLPSFPSGPLANSCQALAVSSLGSCRCCFAACLRRAAGLPQFIGEVALAADGQDAPNRLSGGIRRRGSVAATCERRVVHVGARRRNLYTDDDGRRTCCLCRTVNTTSWLQKDSSLDFSSYISPRRLLISFSELYLWRSEEGNNAVVLAWC